MVNDQYHRTTPVTGKILTRYMDVCRHVWITMDSTVKASITILKKWTLNSVQRVLEVLSSGKICMNFMSTCLIWGTAVAQWLRYCATNRKVVGSIPDGVIGIFH
jgi:hypothetical protein